MSWNSGAFGPPGFTSADWLPLFGFHSPLAALLSISAPPEPANQGPVETGNPVLALNIRLAVVPSAGDSNPQSPTRFPATVEQSGCVVWALAGGASAATNVSATRTPATPTCRPSAPGMARPSTPDRAGRGPAL